MRTALCILFLVSFGVSAQEKKDPKKAEKPFTIKDVNDFKTSWMKKQSDSRGNQIKRKEVDAEASKEWLERFGGKPFKAIGPVSGVNLNLAFGNKFEGGNDRRSRMNKMMMEPLTKDKYVIHIAWSLRPYPHTAGLISLSIFTSQPVIDLKEGQIIEAVGTNHKWIGQPCSIMMLNATFKVVKAK